MAKEPHTSLNGSETAEAPDIAAQRKATYSRLFWRFIWLTILCSLLPLLLVGWGINLGVYYLALNVAGIYYIVSQIIAVAVATMWNFFSNLMWTWRVKPHKEG